VQIFFLLGCVVGCGGLFCLWGFFLRFVFLVAGACVLCGFLVCVSLVGFLGVVFFLFGGCWCFFFFLGFCFVFFVVFLWVCGCAGPVLPSSFRELRHLLSFLQLSCSFMSRVCQSALSYLFSFGWHLW